MSEIHALSGAYAVDALDDIERTQFEQHLAECAECRAEVASFRETGALLAETEVEAPPASLRSSVLAGISQVRPLPPGTEPAGTTAPAEHAVRRRRLPHLLLAAAAVVLLAVGVLAWHPWQHDTTTIAAAGPERTGCGPGDRAAAERRRPAHPGALAVSGARGDDRRPRARPRGREDLPALAPAAGPGHGVGRPDAGRRPADRAHREPLHRHVRPRSASSPRAGRRPRPSRQSPSSR